MEQKVESLEFNDLARVEEQRSWVRDHFAPEETYKLQCLGITLGDVLVQELGLKWIAVEDEHGRTPSLILEGTTIIVFPLTMISKRIESGDDVDVYRLVEDVRKTVGKLKQEQA